MLASTCNYCKTSSKLYAAQPKNKPTHTHMQTHIMTHTHEHTYKHSEECGLICLLHNDLSRSVEVAFHTGFRLDTHF